jgi:WD40 repeat protein
MAIGDVAYVPGSPLLAAAGWDTGGPSVRFWSLDTGAPVRVINLNPLLYSSDRGRLANLAFSGDGSIFAVTEPDGGLRVRRTADGSVIMQTVVENPWDPADGTGAAVALSRDGTLVAVSKRRNTAIIMRVADGATQATVTAGDDSESISSLTFSPDGRELLTSLYSSSLQLDGSPIQRWSTGDGSPLGTLRAGDWGILHLASTRTSPSRPRAQPCGCSARTAAWRDWISPPGRRGRGWPVTSDRAPSRFHPTGRRC